MASKTKWLDHMRITLRLIHEPSNFATFFCPDSLQAVTDVHRAWPLEKGAKSSGVCIRHMPYVRLRVKDIECA
jgi:hypothetical protein